MHFVQTFALKAVNCQVMWLHCTKSAKQICEGMGFADVSSQFNASEEDRSDVVNRLHDEWHWEDLKVHEDPNLVGVAMKAHNIVPSKTTALVHPAESDVCRAVTMSLEASYPSNEDECATETSVCLDTINASPPGIELKVSNCKKIWKDQRHEGEYDPLDVFLCCKRIAYKGTFWFPFGTFVLDHFNAHVDPNVDALGTSRRTRQREVPEMLCLIFELIAPMKLCILDHKNDSSGKEESVDDQLVVDVAKSWKDQANTPVTEEIDCDDPTKVVHCFDPELKGETKKCKLCIYCSECHKQAVIFFNTLDMDMEENLPAVREGQVKVVAIPHGPGDGHLLHRASVVRRCSVPRLAQFGRVDGLVNAAGLTNRGTLEDTTVEWCRKIMRHSPIALRMIKVGLNAELDGQAGIQELAGNATMLYYMTDEAQEGKNAFLEKRDPDWDQFPKLP